jgi:hypothetical protein
MRGAVLSSLSAFHHCSGGDARGAAGGASSFNPSSLSLSLIILTTRLLGCAVGAGRVGGAGVEDQLAGGGAGDDCAVEEDDDDGGGAGEDEAEEEEDEVVGGAG